MLVEVVIALGIIAFALISVYSLLPAGLGSMREAEENAAATALLEELASAIGNARAVEGVYTATGVYSGMSWSYNGALVEHEFENLSLAGTPVPATATSPGRLKARVELTPPSPASPAGNALIAVAWPVTAEWDPDAKRWTGQQGALYSRIIFIPRES